MIVVFLGHTLLLYNHGSKNSESMLFFVVFVGCFGVENTHMKLKLVKKIAISDKSNLCSLGINDKYLWVHIHIGCNRIHSITQE